MLFINRLICFSGSQNKCSFCSFLQPLGSQASNFITFPAGLLLFACPLLKEWHFKHGSVCVFECVRVCILELHASFSSPSFLSALFPRKFLNAGAFSL